MELIKKENLKDCKWKVEYTNRWFDRDYYSYKDSPYQAMKELFALKDMEFTDDEINYLIKEFGNAKDQLTKEYLKIAKIKTNNINTVDEYNRNKMLSIIKELKNANSELDIVKTFRKFIIENCKNRKLLFDNKEFTNVNKDHNKFCRLYWQKGRELDLDLN